MRIRPKGLFWAATLLFVSGGSYLSARLTALHVSKRLWVAGDVSSARFRFPSGPAKPESLTDYRVITERSLFGRKSPPPPPPPEVAAAPPVLPPPPPVFAPPSPAGPPEPAPELRVVGTAVMQGAPSFALIEARRDVRIVKVKEEILPGAVLSAVYPEKIQVLWRDGTEEFQLFETLPRGPALPTGRHRLSRSLRTVPAQPPASPEPAPEQSSVVQRDENSWIVDSREVERVRSDLGSLMTQIRVVPNFTNGQSDGFKIFAIRPGSLFARMGLQNGDVIKSINGMQIQAPEQAFEAYQMLQNETKITVDVRRRNENRSLSYEIR